MAYTPPTFWTGKYISNFLMPVQEKRGGWTGTGSREGKIGVDIFVDLQRKVC
jgi:hypothetical protein